MPSFNSFEKDGVKVKVRGRGLVRRLLLSRWPYFTGDTPIFHVSVEATKQGIEVVRREIRYGRGDASSSSNLKSDKSDVRVNLAKPLIIDLDTKWLVIAGQHWIELRMQIDDNGVERGISENIISFDVRSSDALALLIFGILATLVITVSNVFGGWWLSNNFRDESPKPTYIVPAPESDGKTDGGGM